MNKNYPMLSDKIVKWEYLSENNRNHLSVECRLEYDHHHYLKHHIVNNVPVMPQIYLLELLSEILDRHFTSLNQDFHIYNYLIKNIQPLRLIKVYPSASILLYLELEILNEGYLIQADVAQDICLQDGTSKRKNIHSFHCDVEKVKVKAEWNFNKIYNKTPDWHQNYPKDQVYLLTNNPYGSLMKTKTGEYRWYKNDQALIGGSMVNVQMDQYIGKLKNPEFIIPLLECDAGIQHLPFYGLLTHNPGIPESIGNITFFSHASENCQILTCVKKIDNFYHIQIFEKETHKVIAQFENCQLKPYPIEVNWDQVNWAPI